jgi:antitoxin component of RelBE/YafQ-DinJ toxin-antitoxin module
MKTQFTITVNEDVKKKFQALTKKLGTNASTVINMYLVKVINT